MKMSAKRTIASCVLTIMLIFSGLSFSVMSESEITELNISRCEIKDKILTYEGKISVGESKAVTIMARKKEEPTVIKYMRIITADETGAFSGAVKIYDEEKEPEFFEMEVLFQSEEAEPAVIETLVYFNEYKKKNSINELKESGDGVLKFMSSENEIYNNIGVRLDLYDAQTEDIKEKMDSLAEGYKKSVETGNAAEIANGSVYTVMANEAKAGEMKQIIAGFDADAKSISVRKNDLADSEEYFSKLNNGQQEWIAENVYQNIPDGGFENYEEFYNVIEKSMFLEFANTSHYMELRNLILANTDILDDNMTALENQKNTSVIDTAMADIVLQASKKRFTEIDVFADAVKAALIKAEKEVGKGGGSASGSGSGGSGGGGGTSSMWGSMGEQENTADDESKDMFNDLEGYEWAKDSIEKLANKGIVSGTGNGRFEPGRDITREEFVKLICEAFNISGSDTRLEFDDVGLSDWFYPYISAAVECGIVQGVSDNSFGTGMKITREDMAVIIHRTIESMGVKISGNGTSFADEESAAEYSREAISVLAENGIINGVGDNRFAPKKNAERAEASVIICRCMEKFLL